MKGFERDDLLLSLCGLNCGLCSMRVGGYCPGCGGGAGNQGCASARCAREKPGVEYCFQCAEFPCAHYDGISEYDLFVTHRNQMENLERAQRDGLDAYRAEQREKAAALALLLDRCNDGRRKTLFCQAANLLELDDVRRAMERIEPVAVDDAVPLRERAAFAADTLKGLAAERGIDLRLRKKPKA